jgi:hypothetical protein
MMKRFVAGAAGTLMVASALMAGAGSASASAPKPAPRPVVSVSHFRGDTLTLSTVAGPKSTITVTLKLGVAAGQARDRWVLGAYRTDDSPVLGAQACGCGLFGSSVAGSSHPIVLKGKNFQETSVVGRFIGDVNGFHVFVTDIKTGVRSEADINSVPVGR